MVLKILACLETEMARKVIKVLVCVVVLGYLMMWIMMPTDTYEDRWFPSITNKTISTYFGHWQGAYLLVYTFPVLFVAALGCVYLYLERRSDGIIKLKSGRANRFGVAWKKPVLTKGPLGIVSRIELAILAMFVALLIWSLAIYLRHAIKVINPQVAAFYGAKEIWQARLGFAAAYLGAIGNICLTFLFFPVARGSSVLPLFGLTYEACVKYHIWLGHMVMVLFTAHGLCYIIYWAVINRTSEIVNWAKTGVSNVAGELSLLFGLVLWVTTFPRIRRKMFELFFYAHHMYILFMLFFCFHLGFDYACIMLPGFYLFMVDRFLRFLQSRARVSLVSARVLPCETIELNFAKLPGLRYTPTSFLFINVPSISKLQWHPFTISSNCNLEPNNLSIMIKVEGSWTKKLYQMMMESSSPIDHLEVTVEGPYGPASTHFLRHDTLVMVSGGSGITPFISVIRELIFASTTQNWKTPQIVLICAFKNSSDLTMLDLLLPISGTTSSLSSLQLKIEAYVTKEKQPTNDHSKSLQTIMFKPCKNDAPIAPILGPNSWLYLCLIISSSFVIFLIIIGLITRYYIYPKDHNTETVFPLSLQAVISVLVMCVSIAFTASAAVMWNKRSNAREAKQILNLEGSTSAGTLTGSSLDRTGRELESQPHEFLSQAINVHYGQRPDLKKMLLECRGSSVRVLTCGPAELRRDVARICASAHASNLHFESISFSW